MTSKLTRPTSPWPRSGRCSARAAVVLLVQPGRDDRDLYAEYLSHMGLTPICVQDADAALRLACRADIIVTELLLPGALDGYELIHRLKHSAPTSNIPIVVLTVCAWTADQSAGAECWWRLIFIEAVPATCTTTGTVPQAAVHPSKRRENQATRWAGHTLNPSSR
jgi:CheY-like chemotaxis protein